MAARFQAARSNSTFLSLGVPRFEALWRASMGSECPEEMTTLFAALLSPWATQPIPESPDWPSDIGDDHTPYEFSLAVGGTRPELRVLVEAQAKSPTPRAYWRAGIALTETIEKDFGAVLAQFRKIEDLFYPESPESPFSIWHAVCLFPDAPPAWKVYLNPQARGRANADAVVHEAMTRLGYPEAAKELRRVAGARGPELDELKYFSLDLSAKPDARVKIYFRHHGVTADELERAFSHARGHQPGDVAEFCRAILDSVGPFVAKPVGSCFAFVGGDTERPSAATLHLPVNRYVDSDAMVFERVSSYLQAHGLPVESYTGPLTAFANRPLDLGSGMHSYASFRRERGKPRVTLYLAPEVYSNYAAAVSHRRMRRTVLEELPRGVQQSQPREAERPAALDFQSYKARRKVRSA